MDEVAADVEVLVAVAPPAVACVEEMAEGLTVTIGVEAVKVAI